jgi:hypothetical protein
VHEPYIPGKWGNGDNGFTISVNIIIAITTRANNDIPCIMENARIFLRNSISGLPSHFESRGIVRAFYPMIITKSSSPRSPLPGQAHKTNSTKKCKNNFLDLSILIMKLF